MNRVSLWVYVHPTSMATYCIHLQLASDGAPHNATSPASSHVVHDLKPGQWNHVLWEIPHLRRDRVTSFTICQTLRGHEPQDEGIVTYDFDRLEIQRVDADQYEGWQVAPGKLAFCHVGYRPEDRKLVLAGDGAGETFELVDADGKVVFAGPVRAVENRRGAFRLLDFSGYRRPGQYRLQCGELQSRTFRIGEDVWRRAMAKAMNFFFCERCGYAVPGIHRECHQDWQGFHGDVKKVINGGWHDAGDLSQGAWRTAMATFAMLRIVEGLRKGGSDPELEERILDEAVWGLQWLLKTRFGDGYRMHWSTMRIYTDNRVGTLDDVVTPAQNVPWENFLTAAVEALAARLLQESHPELAQQCLNAAIEDWQAAVASRERWDQAEYREAAWGAMSSVLLDRATGDAQHAEHAVRCGRLLIRCQEQRFLDGIPITGYFYHTTNRRAAIHNHHAAFEEAPLIALAALCNAYPNHGDWINWYAAAALHSEFFLKRGSRIATPYELLPNSVWRKSQVLRVGNEKRRNDMLRQFHEGARLDDEHVLRTFPIYRDGLFHGNTNVQLSSTWALAEASRLRGDARGMRLVGRQFEWVFGGNPFGQSLMYGEGYDFAPQFAYCLKNVVGSLPVGIDSMSGDQPYWSGSNYATFKEIWVEPVSRFLGAISIYAMPSPPAPRRRAANEPVKLDVAVGPVDRDDRTLELEVTATGAGKHEITVRTFNCTADAPRRRIELFPDKPVVVRWTLPIEDPQKPWVLVITADGDKAQSREVVGAFVEADLE